MSTLRDGLSIAALPITGPLGLSGAVSAVARSQDPTSVMAQAQADQTYQSLTLPRDRPPLYFRIDVQNYERKSWREIGQLDPQWSINLPIPDSLVDSHNVDWEGRDLGFMGSIPLGAETVGAGGWFTRGAARFGGAVGGSVADGFMASQGVAINNYLTMMLKGPTYKQHKFAWRFSPNDEQETLVLARLHKILHDAQAPAISSYAGSAFWEYPKVFKPSFNSESGADMRMMLYGFKPCVLTNMAFNFTPGNVPAFYGRTNAPESVDVAMEFTELEFWLRGDYGEGFANEPLGWADWIAEQWNKLPGPVGTQENAPPSASVPGGVQP